MLCPLLLTAVLLPTVAVAMPGKGAAGAMGHEGYGQPLPSPELPPGVITILVIGKDMSDKHVGEVVRLVGLADGVKPRETSTGKDGRARFDALVAGQRYRLELPKGGPQARSADFAMPALGGLRFLLSSAAKTSATASASSTGSASAPASSPNPPHGAPGHVHGAKAADAPAKGKMLPPTKDRSKLRLGPGTHLLGQLNEDNVSFMQMLELSNGGKAPIDASGLRFTYPAGVMHLRVDESGLFKLSADKQSVVLAKPVPPGRTRQRVTFQLNHRGGLVNYRQVLPLAAGPTLFAVTNFNKATVRGPSYKGREVRGDMPVFQLASVAANQALELTIAGLPYHDPLPRNLALAGVGLLLLWVLATAIGAGPRRRARESRREALLQELTDLAAGFESGAVKKRRYEQRREQVVSELRPHWDD